MVRAPMYRLLYWLVLQRLPAEGTHRVSFALLRALVAIPGVGALVHRWFAPKDPALEVTAFGRKLPGPLGLAAGFDKDAKGTRALLALGFGFVEVGTVTAEGQPGNPKPRLFRRQPRAGLHRLHLRRAVVAAPATASARREGPRRRPALDRAGGRRGDQVSLRERRYRHPGCCSPGVRLDKRCPSHSRWRSSC